MPRQIVTEKSKAKTVAPKKTLKGKPTLGKDGDKKRQRQSRGGYKIVDYAMRVEIIYDSLVHNIQPIEISRARDIKYNTVRHVLQQYYQKGCINTIKYKAVQNKLAVDLIKTTTNLS